MRKLQASNDLAPVVERVVSDYNNWFDPFEPAMLPEKEAIMGINNSWDRSMYVTLTCALNYNRDARQLWERTRELFDNHPRFFDPHEVINEIGIDGIKEEFHKGGIRYPNRDAETWYTICQSLTDRFNESVVSLVSRNDYDARQVFKFVQQDDGFPFLGGDKIAPLWIRIMHEDVVKMNNISAIDIPVDVQVIRVTEHLQENEFINPFDTADCSIDGVREFWKDFCFINDMDPVIVDQPIWLIGNAWDKWGKDYINTVMEEEG